MMLFPHQMGPAPPRPPSQGQSSSIIDLTEENMPESSLKKLEDTVDNFSYKDGKSVYSNPDAELSALLLNETEGICSPSAMKNTTASGPKNENASTSLEGVLTGSGEVGKASPPDPIASSTSFPGVKVRTCSQSGPSTLATFLGHGSVATSTIDRNLHPGGLLQQPQHQQDIFHPHQLPGASSAGVPAAAVPSHPKVVSSSSMTDIMDVKSSLSTKKATMKPSVSADSAMDRRSGLFEKFDFTGQTVPAGHSLSTGSVTTGIAITSLDSEDQMMPKMRLKLHPFRAPHGKSQSLDTSVTPSPTSAGSKSSNSNTFDFRSDEEEDEPIAYSAQPEHRLSVFASSATCLQISSKAKTCTTGSMPETSPSIKPEKYKRKDKSGSGNSTKRRRDREDSRKEKKRKKLELGEFYHTSVKEPMYRSATIEGDDRSGTKLKIRVSKEHIKTPSPLKESSKLDKISERADKLSEKINEAAKRSSPLVGKLVLSKQDLREHMVLQDMGCPESTQMYHSSVTKSSKMSSGKAGAGGSNSALSKSDPKLAKATIRLKPLNMSTAASASVTLAPPAKSLLGGRGGSERSERRSQSTLATTGVSTPTTPALSLSSILPNAPTASSVASLPPIPKLSSSSASSTSASGSGKSANSVMTPASKTVASSNSIANNVTPKGSVNVNVAAGSRGPGNSNLTSSVSRSSPNAVGGTAGLNKLSNSNSGSQKVSSGIMSHKLSGGASSVGIPKGSGSAGQSSNSQKMSGMPNQSGGPQKVSSSPNQYSYSQKGPGVPNQSGPQRIASVSGHGSQHKQSSSTQGGVGVSKSAHSSVQKMPCSVNQSGNYQKVAIGGNQQKESNSPNQGSLPKSGSQHVMSQKISTTPQSGASHKVSGSGHQGGSLQRTASGSFLQGNVIQKNSMQSQATAAQKGQVSGNTISITSPSQKSGACQGRSMSTGGYSSSPNSSGRLPGGVKSNSAFSSAGRTPPNHLSINRSLSNPCPKTGSGSSPRASAGQSPSTPTTSRFPSNSPQRNPGTSPSNSSQRNPQVSSSQRPSSISQATSSQRQSGSQGSNSQRPSLSPLSHQRTNSFSGCSPNHRPASTPCSASSGEQRVASGACQSPGYPVRPSSAGPRQSSSPLGSRQNQSPGGTRSGSSPSSQRTASPLGQKQNVLGQKQSLGSNSVMGGVSPHMSRQTASVNTDSLSLPRQNSSGNINPSGIGQKQNILVNDDAVASTPSMPRQSTPFGNAATNSSGTAAPAKPAAADVPSSISSSPSGQQSTADNSINTLACKSSAMNNCNTNTNSSSGALRQTSVTAVSLNRASAAGTCSGTGQAVPSKTASSVVSVSGKTQSTKTFFNAGGTLSKNPGTGNLVPSNSIDSFNKSTLSLDTNNCVSSASEAVESDGMCHTSLGAASSGTETLQATSSITTMPPSLVSTISASAACPAVSASVPNNTALSSAYPTHASAALPLMSASKMSAVPRGRKGSLSAIVNKLATKVGSSAAAVGSEPHDAMAISSSGEGLGAEKSTSGGAGNDSTKETPHLAHVQTHSAALLLARRRSAADGENAIGQGEQDRGSVKRQASISGLSPPSSEPKIARIDSFSKAIAMALSAPSAHIPTSPHMAAAATPAAVGERASRLSSGSDRASPLAKEMGLPLHRAVEEVGLDLSLPKDRTYQECAQTSQKMDSRTGVGKSSPRNASPGLCSSPVQGGEKIGGTKFNGESSRDKSRVESDVFKVPTPKTLTSEDDERCGSAGVGRSCGETRSSGTRQIPASPLSDASSPDSGLIIDCEESPNHNSSKPMPTSNATNARIPTPPILPSPKRVVELTGEQGLGSLGRVSPSISSKATPSPSARTVKNSPSEPSSHTKPSPNSKNSPAPASPHPKEAPVNSPCEIDDELMDAALMGFGS